jgi:hypothetical protein
MMHRRHSRAFFERGLFAVERRLICLIYSFRDRTYPFCPQ